MKWYENQFKPEHNINEELFNNIENRKNQRQIVSYTKISI